MGYFNKLAAILCTIAYASLCIGMENLSKEHRSNLIMHADQFSLITRNHEDYLQRAFQYVDLIQEKNGFFPIPVSLENLKSLSVPEQLLAFTKLCASLHGLTDEYKFYRGAVQAASLFYLAEDETRRQGYLFLFQHYYETNNFKNGYDILRILAGRQLKLIEKAEIENIMVKIFSTMPEAIKYFVDQLYETSHKIEYGNISNCFLNAICQLKLVPILDDVTLYNIGLSYANESMSKMEMCIKYANQSMLYFVFSAKSGNIEAFNTLMIILKETKQLLRFYTCLIPLMRANDPEAQVLFNKICYASESALSWMNQYKEKQEKLKHLQQHQEELKMAKRVMTDFNCYKGQKKYLIALDKWKSEPSVALDCLLEADKLSNPEAEAKLIEMRASEGYKQPKNAHKNDHGRLLKERDIIEAQKFLQVYKTKIAAGRKNYKNFINISTNKATDEGTNHAMIALYQAKKLGNEEAKKEVERVQKSKGYQDKQKGLPSQKLAVMSFDDHFGQHFHCLESAFDLIFEDKIRAIPKVEDKGGHNSNEPVIQETYLKTDKAGTTHNNSNEATSTTTASSTTSVVSSRKRGKGRQYQELHPSSNEATSTTTASSTTSVVSSRKRGKGTQNQELPPPSNPTTTNSTLTENKDSIIASIPQEIDKALSTISGEGTSIPFIESKENNEQPKVKKVRSRGLENEEPKIDEKATRSTVRKTLERTTSVNSLKTESKRKELRRTLTVMSFPSHATSKTLSNIDTSKKTSSTKGDRTSEEKTSSSSQEKTKSKRSSSGSIDHSTSESESESKKTPRKFSKKSSSSSLSSSMESSVKIKNPTDPLIPENLTIFYPRHYRHVRKTLTYLYKLDKDDQDTLKVILGTRNSAFETNNDSLKRLINKLTTQGSHFHGSHEIIHGFAHTIDPTADLNKRTYTNQLNELQNNIMNNIAPRLTVADYEASQKNNTNG